MKGGLREGSELMISLPPIRELKRHTMSDVRIFEIYRYDPDKDEAPVHADL
jgi:hypothetical protein